MVPEMPVDQPHNSEKLGHEPITLSARTVSLGMAVLMGVVIASLVLVGGLLLYLSSRYGGQPIIGASDTPIEYPPGVPSLDSDQTGSLRELRARERKILTEYAWTEPEAGIARIPIRRAMEILGQESSPTPEQPSEDTNAQ
jgi:hypothetical protein